MPWPGSSAACCCWRSWWRESSGPDARDRAARRHRVDQGDPGRAVEPAGLAVCFSIADRAAAEAWIARLDELGVEHSPLFEATTGWMVRLHDPDGIEIRLYSLSKDDGVDHNGERGYAQPVR